MNFGDTKQLLPNLKGQTQESQNAEKFFGNQSYEFTNVPINMLEKEKHL